ncbi:MAG: synthase chain [Burkholderiaceae bacterium]|nr:synthase chain [Burkholderiaceae bacterium]
MARIVVWQLVVALVYVALAVVIGGEVAGISALLGTASCVVPNMLFMLGYNRLVESGSGQASLGVFLGLELAKVILTIVLMVASVWYYREVSWVYFLLGLAIALKSYILFLLKNRS